MAPPDSLDRAVILIPMFNDWESAELLLASLDAALANYPMRPEVLLIDDGSTIPKPPAFASRPFTYLHSVDILELRRNLGHQRAIATGLVFVYQNRPCRAVVVMDADGEDLPSDIPRLTAKFQQEGERFVLFAARAKRLERLWFRFLYQVYRLIHWILTGDVVRVGNFSILPFSILGRLMVTPEIWNHYAAAVIRSGVGWRSIPIARGKRLTGKSRMNFTAMLLHGLSAFFVYGEIVGARLLVAIALALIFGAVLVTTGIALRFTIKLAVPGLLAYAAGILGIALLQAVLIALMLVFTVIGSRANIGFLPIRDCGHFVNRVERIFLRVADHRKTPALAKTDPLAPE